jgi:hypothetical protein
MPTLNPPGSTARANVADSRVDYLLSAGWTLVTDEPDEPEPGPPPKAGRGSGREAWADYAHNVVGIEVPDDWNRNDIIAAVEGA